jgi:two-component system cell cycle response regulator
MMHAVLVDPSRVVLKMLGGLITERGGKVSDFSDSASALRAIQNDPTVDVLITSMEVQPMGGLELCWEARMCVPARRPFFIIVMSSLSDDRRLAEALDCGADDLIGKPVRGLELHARLRMAGRMKAAQHHLVLLAETDSMTGLLNRRAFFERLHVDLKDRQKTASLSAIMFDIDHFKRVNDSYGHDVGDVVIKAIAAEAAGRAELVARLGGEEFVIILTDRDEGQAFRFADSLRRTCAKLPFDAAGKPFSVTCSFGVSRYVAGDTADGLLKRADIALYQAKEGGRNRVEVSGQTAPTQQDESENSASGVARKRRRDASER